ncbi:DUF6461 domain-containing protein [[Kitasatospora] papulosa]|uniref:DUF6461 domain-containing protein n=1 Tax=Streptomyces TaxID=1883 RepID=UPI002E139151|nr:DUF6461 domain-containing protein [[Kitasatospora] papulosa]
MDRLSEVLSSEYFCVTAVRGLPQQDLLDRLEIVVQGALQEYRLDNAIEHLGFDSWGVRIYAPADDEWIYLFDVNGQTGVAHMEPVLRRLSRGTEAISVWSLLDSTTHVTQARDGEVIATCSTWLFEPAAGSDPDRLNTALRHVGFFLEDEPEGFDDARAALEAVETEFGLRVEAGAVKGPLPTVFVSSQLS